MMKKAMPIAMVVAALAAIAAPVARATFVNSNWSMHGFALKESGTVQGTGQFKFNSTSGLGGIECHVVVHAAFTASSNAGSITKFTATNCMNFGFLLTVCGTNANATPTVPWKLDGQKTEGTRRILLTAPAVHFEEPEADVTCMSIGKMNISGSNATNPVFLTPDSTTTMTKLTFGGEVDTAIGASKAEGTITLTSGSGTYGIL